MAALAQLDPAPGPIEHEAGNAAALGLIDKGKSCLIECHSRRAAQKVVACLGRIEVW